MKKNTISTFLLSCSIAFLFFIFYKSEITFNGIKTDYFLKYYIIGFILIFFSLITYLLIKETVLKIFTIGISIIFGLYLVEGYFYVTFFDEKKNRISKSKLIEIKKSQKNYDFRSTYEFYKDYQKKNPEVVLSIIPEIFKREKKLKFFPFSGISNKETIHGNENGYFSIYNSDRYGFNNPDHIWDNEEIDILLIGDSFVHGSFVNEEDSIAGNLRKDSKYKILNLGYKGNGPLIEFATLREYLERANPKKVLYFYFEGNDLHEVKDEIKNELLLKYLNDDLFSQNLINKQKNIDELIKIKLENIEKKDFLKFLTLNTVRKLTIEEAINYPLYEQKISEHFIDIIKKTKILLSKKNIDFTFVYLPEHLRYSKNVGDNVSYNDYGKILELLKNLNIHTIDIHENVFKKQKDPLELFPFRSDGHYNELGYKLLSKNILENLKNINF